VFNATHVGLVGKKLLPAVVQLNIAMAARSLMERRYSFLLHVPVWSGSGWQFAAIDARLDVHAVADAQQSEVRVGSASNVSRPESAAVVANHLEKVVVEMWCSWTGMRTLRLRARRAFGWSAQKASGKTGAPAPKRPAIRK
jgi:hypothetical protein